MFIVLCTHTHTNKHTHTNTDTHTARQQQCVTRAYKAGERQCRAYARARAQPGKFQTRQRAANSRRKEAQTRGLSHA